MIHFITATYSEAKALISFYKLKKLIFIKEFQVFYNSNLHISLTISGIGKVLSASAVVFTFYLFEKKKNDSWINLGIAGHENKEIGEIFLVKKIIDSGNNKSWFPSFIFNMEIKKESCKTFDKPNYNYSSILYDMELSGFYEVATRFSSNELIHSLKIISDNKHQKKIEKDDACFLVEKNIKVINDFYIKILDILHNNNEINKYNPYNILNDK